MRPHHISSSFQELKVVRFRFVGSCQLNSRLIKSKFFSEFIGTEKPTKFVSCRFVGSCQLNSRLIKSKFVSEFVGTQITQCSGGFRLKLFENSCIINHGIKPSGQQ